MNRWLRLLRLPFLSVTVVAWALGTAAAADTLAGVDPWRAGLALGFVLLVHAGANVLNDYYDARNGSDAANINRVEPFTGGSRLIQNGEIGERTVGRVGAALMLAAVLPGLGLIAGSGPALVSVGILGAAIAWLYSAPPLALMSRGLGEPAIALAWGLLVLACAAVHSAAALAQVLPVAPAYGLMVATVLFINTFPDRAADASAGKRTLVVRLGTDRARWLYPLLIAPAFAAPMAAVAWGGMPTPTLLACCAMPLSLLALRGFWRDANAPARLLAPIRLSILAALVHGTGLAGGFALAAAMR